MAIDKNDYLDGNGNYDLKKELVDELIDGVNEVADYIVDSSSNPNVGWEKWNSGKLVQWGRLTGSAGGYTTQSSGEIYRADLVDAAFPISFFNNDPIVYMNIVATSGLNGWQMLVGQPNAGRTGNICLMRHGSDANVVTYLLTWNAIGRWK